MCPQERLVIISNQTGLSFVLKRIGPLAAIISLAFYLLVLYLSEISKPPEYLSVSIYSESFIENAVNTFCSSLGSTFLLIEDTTIHPLYLWVISTSRFRAEAMGNENSAPPAAGAWPDLQHKKRNATAELGRDRPRVIFLTNLP